MLERFYHLNNTSVDSSTPMPPVTTIPGLHGIDEDLSVWEKTHRPRLIILIRHGESESNIDKSVNEYIPNQHIPLTDKGWKQAHYAGVQLLRVLNLDDEGLVDKLEEEYDFPTKDSCILPMKDYTRLDKHKDREIVFYTSPYKRARQTLKGILDVLDRYNELNCRIKLQDERLYNPEGKCKFAFWPQPREYGCNSYENVHEEDVGTIPPGKTYIAYRVKDEPRIREQDFGNFQKLSSMKDVLQKRATYGHFFFRFPQGESAADVFNRVGNFQETLFRHFRTVDFNKPRDVVVLVTHGIFSRVFLMKWFGWTYEEFESFTNVPNGCVIVMEYDENINTYNLRTVLRKWDDEES